MGIEHSLPVPPLTPVGRCSNLSCGLLPVAPLYCPLTVDCRFLHPLHPGYPDYSVEVGARPRAYAAPGVAEDPVHAVRGLPKATRGKNDRSHVRLHIASRVG